MTNATSHTPDLPRCYKQRFPFRIGTTSFIYPAAYIPNVQRLAPYVDEIELLFLESDRESSLPPPGDIAVLADLSASEKVSYNIHLPTDMDPGAADRSERRKAVETIQYIRELTHPLAPSTYTLHLPADAAMQDSGRREQWLNRLSDTMDHIIGPTGDGRLFSIETLHYPFQWLTPLLESWDLSVCLDIGHVLTTGYDLAELYNTFQDRISIIHLHGVSGQTDHIALDRMSSAHYASVMRLLKSFFGIVSVEVFAYSPLAASLQVLETSFGGRK